LNRIPSHRAGVTLAVARHAGGENPLRGSGLISIESRTEVTEPRAVVLAEIEGIRQPNAYGDSALVAEDPTKPSEAYFRHVDWIVEKANGLGLVIGLLPTWGDKVGKPQGHGPQIFTPENASVYGEMLGRRYSHADLVWIIGGDRFVDDDEKQRIWRSLARGLRAGGVGTHFVTFHPRGGGDAESTSSYAFPTPIQSSTSICGRMAMEIARKPGRELPMTTHGNQSNRS
jgi:hypothetical protein